MRDETNHRLDNYMDTIEHHVYAGNMQQRPQELASALLKSCWETDAADSGQPLLQAEMAKHGGRGGKGARGLKIDFGTTRKSRNKGVQWEVYG
jgi:hypothetical protein